MTPAQIADHPELLIGLIMPERPDLWLGITVGLVLAAVVVVLAIISDRRIRNDFPENKP